MRRLDTGEFLDRLDSMRDIFRDALGYGGLEARVLAFPALAREHSRRPGFRAAGAFEEQDLTGFTYGCPGAPGQWWHDQVARALSPSDRTAWLDGAFELVELHVRPDRQGRGLGGRLHDLLLKDVDSPSAVLSTPAREGRAMLLYRARGWRTLAEGALFEGVRERYRILGLRLRPGPP